MTDTTETGTTPLEALQAAIGWTAEERVDVVEQRHLRDYRRAIGADPDSTDVPVTITASFLTEPPTMPEALAYGPGWVNGGGPLRGDPPPPPRGRAPSPP